MVIRIRKSAEPARRDQLAAFCKALAHPARVQMLEVLLSMNNCCCGDIVDCFDLAQSTVSQHLAVLKEAGLVTGEEDGPRMCYGVNRDALKRFRELVLELPR